MEPAQKALNAIALIEQFETLITNIETFQGSLPQVFADELAVHLATLKGLTELLDVDDLQVVDAKLSSIRQPSKIERLGIAGELIRLRTEGKPISELATAFAIDGATISRFFKGYD